MSDEARPIIRTSHALRAGCDDLTVLRAAVRRARAPAPGGLTHVNLDAISNGDRLCARLKFEYRALLMSLVEEDGKIERGIGVPLSRDIRFSLARDVGATATLIGESCRIELQFGTFLAIDDALITACATPGFGTSTPAVQEAAPRYAIATIGPETPERYFDYRHTERLAANRLGAAFTNIMPLDIARLAHVDLLVGLALQWVVLHEHAHDLLGHLGWRDARHGLAGRRIEETAFLSGSGEEESFCLELQADALATHLLVGYVMTRSGRNNRRVADYLRAMRAQPPSAASRAIDFSSLRERFRLALLAAGIAPLIFELRRERTSQTSLSHPPPAVRLLSIFLCALDAWHNVVDGRLILPTTSGPFDIDQLRPALSAAVQTFVDLEVLARVIRLRSPLYLSEALDVESARRRNPQPLSPLARDFLELAFEGAKPVRFRTPAARSYRMLRAKAAYFHAELAPHAKILLVPYGA
jgi:hypothetical protein